MNGNAVILAPWECSDTKMWLTKRLRRLVRVLVARINAAAGWDMLYLTECAGVWFLYGRVRKSGIDKLLLRGYMDVDELTRLVVRLQDEMEVKI